jgi:hypothetical protein
VARQQPPANTQPYCWAQSPNTAWTRRPEPRQGQEERKRTGKEESPGGRARAHPTQLTPNGAAVGAYGSSEPTHLPRTPSPTTATNRLCGYPCTPTSRAQPPTTRSDPTNPRTTTPTARRNPQQPPQPNPHHPTELTKKAGRELPVKRLGRARALPMTGPGLHLKRS